MPCTLAVIRISLYPPDFFALVPARLMEADGDVRRALRSFCPLHAVYFIHVYKNVVVVIGM